MAEQDRPSPAPVLAEYMRRARARRDGYDPVAPANLTDAQIQELIEASR